MNYQIGDLINHKVFGKGKVVGIEPRTYLCYGKEVKDSSIIKVEFDEAMLTEKEKGFWWIKEPIKIREFTETSLPEYSLVDIQM